MADNLNFCLASDSLCPVDLSDNRDTWGHVEKLKTSQSVSADVFVFIVPAAAHFFFIRDAPANFFFQDLI